METPKEVLVRYLQAARDAVLWKLEGLDDYDVRRPMTPTGTNLLGLVKHLASVELGYFVECFGREMPVALPWHEDDAEDNADMWATDDESREDVIGLYHLAWREAAKTFAELDLDAEGRVPWWEPDDRVTLQQLLVHVIAETNRHAGHADVVRESIDGAAGLRAGVSNLPEDGFDWPAYVARLEAAAETFLPDDRVAPSGSIEEVARARVLADHALEEDSLVLVRDKELGDAAAVAVTFDGPDGLPRLGFVGLDRRSDGLWRESGGFLSGVDEAGPDAVFTVHGGWGNGRRSVHGGWVADDRAATARLVDTASGDVVAEDDVEEGVAILIVEGAVTRGDLRVDLYDAGDQLLRSGPVTGHP